MREIIVDNFAGGGGASIGIALAIGRSVDIAINHDPVAVAMHKANHPETKHYCESVWDVDPRKVADGRPVGLCWLSPDCKHFSKAKGGKPVEKNIRGLAWVAVRWAATVKPRVIILENVEEFRTWGPLLETGMPDPKQKGRTFKAFVHALQRQGYKVDWRELRACDYGTPTIRKRLFLIARCDGKPIVWPKPTHGDPDSDKVKSGKLKPWRTAAEIIDWSIPCPSIFERKRPLADNTMRRIARGIQKFVIENPQPFIVKPNHTTTKGIYDCFRGQSLNDPLQTITSSPGFALVTPFISRQFGKSVGHEVGVPLGTVTAGGSGKSALICPTLIQTGYGEREGQAPRVPGLDKPLGTVVAGGQKHALVSAFLMQYHQEKQKHEARGQVMDRPVLTLDTSNRYAVVAASIAKHYGGNYSGPGSAMDAPLPTITTVDHNALVTSHMVKLRGTNIGHRTDEPLHTITAGGLHLGEVRAFLLKYYGSEDGQAIGGPLHTVTTKDRFGLVTVEGHDYQIVDIGMRMLEPHELFAAQGFPANYITDRDEHGRPLSKAAQVAKCGNAVPPPFAEHLVRANLPELCSETPYTVPEPYPQPMQIDMFGGAI